MKKTNLSNFATNPRAAAAQVLLQVVSHQRSLTDVLNELPKHQAEISLVKAICYGTLRWYYQLNEITKLLVSQPLKNKDADIHLLLLIGLFQLIYLKTPQHAAVTQTVEAVRELNKQWATRLVNGVLRTFLRDPHKYQNPATQSISALYAHPQWLIKAFQQAWPKDWQEILSANNQHPPLCLRINRLQTSRDDYLKNLAEQEIAASTVPNVASAVIITTPQNIQHLYGFNTGQFSVQDSAGQLVAQFLNLAPKQRVLDACCAPGGKTMHILETQPDISELIAIDIDGHRLEKAKENWLRLKLSDCITWITADAKDTNAWWDGRLFDRILLDAPCSATGVIRRHPDIKLLRKSDDIKNFTQQQIALLEKLWPLLAVNGLLLYTTCSILPEENSQVISYFLANHPDAEEKKIQEKFGLTTEPGLQILPGMNNMDGFYFARLIKK